MSRQIATFFGCLLAAVLLTAPVSAKSYHHPLIEQVVTVRDDGRIDVVDTRSYEFDGEFHNAFLRIDPHRRGVVDFDGVEAVDGKSLRNVRVEDETIRWSYDARNETRRFRIRYSLTGEVERAPDAALIDRLLIEPEHAAIDAYKLTVVVPRKASLLKVFVITKRGILGEMDIDPDSGRATITMDGIRRNRWVRIRALFDPDQVPGVEMGSAPMYERWLTETSQATSAYRNNIRSRLGMQSRKPFPTAVAPVLALVAGLFSMWSFRRYRAGGTEPQVGDIGEYFREPPEEIPPAVVPYVMHQFSPGTTVAADALGATLLDFARRGFLTLKERDKRSFLGFGGGTEVDFVLGERPGHGNLTPFESDVWTMLEVARGDDNSVTPKELKKFFQKRTTWIRKWSPKPRRWYERTHGSLLVGGHGGWMVLMILSGIVIMGGLILAGAVSANRVVFITALLSGITAGLFGVVCGAAMPQWKPETLLRARKWKAYQRFLSDFSAMKDAPAEHYKMWDYHFIYATSLGVAKKYLKNIKKVMVEHPDRFHTPAWIVASNPHATSLSAADGLSLAQANMESLQANLSALESALSTTTSSGGGFSGGGAGGASGGGGGSGAS